MKIDVISHCAIDTIEINNSKHVVPGGPGCYCSLTARALKFDVKLHTKFGSDFTLTNYLTEQNTIKLDREKAKEIINEISKIHNIKTLSIGSKNSDLVVLDHKFLNFNQNVKFLYKNKTYNFSTKLIGKVQIKNILMSILAASKSKLKLKKF